MKRMICAHPIPLVTCNVLVINHPLERLKLHRARPPYNAGGLCETGMVLEYTRYESNDALVEEVCGEMVGP